MKKTISKRVISTAVLALFGLIVASCTPRTGGTTKSYDDNWRFVPRVHVENASFGVTAAEYRSCSYDQLYDGYWCPKR